MRVPQAVERRGIAHAGATGAVQSGVTRMSELVDRLRLRAETAGGAFSREALHEAADEIERLMAVEQRALECCDRERGPAFGDAFRGGEASLRTAEYIANG